MKAVAVLALCAVAACSAVVVDRTMYERASAWGTSEWTMTQRAAPDTETTLVFSVTQKLAGPRAFLKALIDPKSPLSATFLAHEESAFLRNAASTPAQLESTLDALCVEGSPILAHPLVARFYTAGKTSLSALVDAVSYPDSPFVYQYVSHSYLGELFGNPEGASTVYDFLARFETSNVHASLHDEYITVTMTVATAEKMLDTVYFEFAGPEGAKIVRTESYSLPKRVAAHVDSVAYTTVFPTVAAKPLFTEFAPNANGKSVPSVISAYYQISNNKISNQGATKALFETIGQSFMPSDLTTYDSEFGVPAQKINKIIGDNNAGSCSANPNNCVEAELDVQVMTAIAQDGITWFWSIPGTESFLEWAKAVASTADAPKVHSISYGAPETEIGNGQATAFGTEVQKLGTMGITVVVASGDDGVAGAGARGNSGGCGFNPSYPATAEYVTAVGGTQGPEDNNPEIVCQSNKGGGITSGGGFSTVWSTPSWQSSQVSNYLANGPNLPPKSMFNANGRGYPDVAMMAHNYPIVVGGNTYLGSGTSAAAPLFGAVITLVNSARLDAGKATLGFLNPKLYAADSSVFHDITSGENNCAAGSVGSEVCCSYGFTATTGWDPASGLGSVDFPKFLAAFQ